MYNFPGSIWCINLITRNDRYESAQNLFNDLDLEVKFYRTERHSNPIQGCFESHQNVIKKSLSKRESYTLIFEDDITLSSSFTIDKLEEAFSIIPLLPENWDILFLGCCPDIYNTYTYKTNIDNIFKVHAHCTHAYIISNRYMKKIAQMKFIEDGKAIDEVYHSNDNAYAYLPSLFMQGLMGSDIGNNAFNNSRFKEWIMNFGDKYAMNMGTPISTYNTFFILLIILVILIIIKLVTLFYTNTN